MREDIKKIREFDNELKGYEERRQYAEKILEENIDMISDYARTEMLEDERLFEDKPINATLEQWGTYLLRSKEVESSRSGEYSFFETEKDYRKLSIGTASISVDVNSEDKVGLFGEFDGGYDKTNDSAEDCIVLDLGSMDNKQINKLIRMGISEKDVSESNLHTFMSALYEYVKSGLAKELDIAVFEQMIAGKSDKDISDELSTPRRTINYKVNKIVDLTKKFSF